jgi:hypothetical protein
MDKVTVNVGELQTKLEENRTKHEKDYKAAMLGFRKKWKVMLSEELNNIENGRETKGHLNLVVPPQHLEDYDQAIEMCAWSTEPIMLLTREQFRNYIMDKWSWSDNFTMLASGYKACA